MSNNSSVVNSFRFIFTELQNISHFNSIENLRLPFKHILDIDFS